MRLDALSADAGLVGLGLLVELRGDSSVDVQSLTHDSRQVRPGGLFACVPGALADGHTFAANAIGSGAVALISERPLDLPVPQIIVTSVRESLGPLSDALYGHPSRHLTVVGVTGTNGKTTTCALLGAIFAAGGWQASTLGTLTQSRTTPEAPELQRRLAELVRDGGQAVAMEVSSHALDQHRADAVHFAAAILTNVTQDHLDYHHTMESYFEAKARLFEPGRSEVAVINRDDSWGARLLDRVTADGIPAFTFGMDDVSDLRLDSTGSRFVWDATAITLHLGGRFNVLNALAAATCARALGIEPTVIAAGLADLHRVRGRFEPVDEGQPFTVLVDYAHTPDGLTQALRAAREMTAGRLLVVFGAGGDRDHFKRPLMGAAAAAADLAVVTSDNPRSEDPGSIIEEIVAGVPGDANVVVEPDRAAAIATVIAAAGPGDVVVIAGKGHETGQEIAGRILEFDDVTEARSALARIRSSRQERDAE